MWAQYVIMNEYGHESKCANLSATDCDMTLQLGFFLLDLSSYLISKRGRI
jgi:hypothetical protein